MTPLDRRRLPEQPPEPAVPDTGPPPGQANVALLGVAIGILLMGIQLWLLSLAFDFYLSGDDTDVFWIAAVSGVIFLGGLLMLKLLPDASRRR